MKRFVLLVVIAAMVIGSSAVMAAEPIKIGLDLDMTGGVAAYGQMGYEGIQVIQEIVKPEVLGRPVQFVLVDSKSDKAEAAVAATRLIEKEKVVAIIGPMVSGAMLAAGAVAEKYKVPIIGPTTTSPLTTQGKKFVFRASFTDPFQGKIAATYAFKNLKAKKAAILADIAQDYCIGLANFFEKEFKRLGGKVVAQQYIKSGDQDFSAQLTAIKNADPDVIYIPNYYTEDALIAVQAKQLGIDVPLISGDGSDAPELFSIGGKAVEGLTATGFWEEKSASTELGKKYIEVYRKKFNKPANAFGALAADSYIMIIEAIKRAGSTDPQKVRDALEATKDLEVVTGDVTIENGDAVKSAVIRKIVNGKWDYLTTVKP